MVQFKLLNVTVPVVLDSWFDAGDADSVGAASRHCTRSHLRPDGPAALWLPDLIARLGEHYTFIRLEAGPDGAV